MSEVIRLVCPACSSVRENRVETLRENIAQWMYNREFQRLLKRFDILVPTEGSLDNYVRRVWEEIQIWDFRKGRERWHLQSDDIRIHENRELIEEVSRRLGLMDITESVIDEPDYVLPLGGARLSNYKTPQKARCLIDEHGWDGVTVVGLSAERPTTDRDRPFYELYAPGAETEFEAMCGGLEKTFSLANEYTNTRHENENINLRSEKRIYDQEYRGGTIAAVAAPSSEPELRRANTLDTFTQFLRDFYVHEASKIILTSHCKYVPFQLMKLMGVALERNIMIDCVGAEAKEHVPEGEHSNYLQEIKATVDAIHNLDIYELEGEGNVTVSFM